MSLQSRLKPPLFLGLSSLGLLMVHNCTIQHRPLGRLRSRAKNHCVSTFVENCCEPYIVLKYENLVFKRALEIYSWPDMAASSWRITVDFLKLQQLYLLIFHYHPRVFSILPYYWNFYFQCIIGYLNVFVIILVFIEQGVVFNCFRYFYLSFHYIPVNPEV